MAQRFIAEQVLHHTR